MGNIRRGLTEKQVMVNMLELLGYLADNEDENHNDCIELERNGVKLTFTADIDCNKQKGCE